MITIHSKTTTKEGTVGCYVTSSLFGAVVGFYSVI